MTERWHGTAAGIPQPPGPQLMDFSAGAGLDWHPVEPDAEVPSWGTTPTPPTPTPSWGNPQPPEPRSEPAVDPDVADERDIETNDEMLGAEDSSYVAICVYGGGDTSIATKRLDAHFRSIGLLRGFDYYIVSNAEDDLVDGGEWLSVPKNELGTDLINWAIIHPGDIELFNSITDFSGNYGDVDHVDSFEPVPASVLRQFLLTENCITASWLLKPNETLTEWCDRITIPTERLKRLARRWQICGRNIETFAHTGNAAERAGDEEVRELSAIVPGLLYESLVTAVCGAPGTGKTTAMFELMAKLCGSDEGPHTFLGMPVERPGGQARMAVFFSGEETVELLNAREAVLAPQFGDFDWVLHPAGKTYEDVLKEMQSMPDGTVFFLDPVDAFMTGSTQDPSSVSEFLRPLVDAAAEKRHCIVLLTHTTKGGSREGAIRSMEDIRNAYSGGPTWLQRVRMMIGIFKRRDGIVEIGIAKTNVPLNHLTFCRPMESRCFRQNAETQLLYPVESDPVSPTGAVPSPPRAGLEAQVIEAVTWARSKGESVRRSGDRSLYALSCPSIKGIGRDRISKAVDAMLASGMLINSDEDGIALID